MGYWVKNEDRLIWSSTSNSHKIDIQSEQSKLGEAFKYDFSYCYDKNDILQVFYDAIDLGMKLKEFVNDNKFKEIKEQIDQYLNWHIHK